MPELDTRMLNPRWVDEKYSQFQREFPRVSREFTRDDFLNMVTLMICHSSAAVQQEYSLADKTVKKIHTFVIGSQRIKINSTSHY